jgi:hypothetical protein
MTETRKNKLISLEKYFFFVIIGLNLIPIISGKFFSTLDGPAHLYNSQLINSLIFEKDSLLNSFFAFTNEPVPNWTGHLILAFFNLFLPAFLSEKIFLFFYMIALPLSFRALLKTTSPNNYFSYLIFPFAYSSVFYLGFYNFSIAIVFMLITINFWLKNEESISSFKNMLKLFLLLTITYFSHIFVFAILILIICIHILLKATILLLNDSNKIKEIFLISFKKLGFLLLPSLLPSALFCYYFYSRPSTGNKVYLGAFELIDSLRHLKPIIALNYEIEVAFTTKLVYVIVIVFAVVLLKRFNDLKNKHILFSKKVLKVSDAWLFVSIIILFMYFILPDSDGNAGFVSVRFGLLFYIFLIIWLSTHTFNKWFSFFVVGIFLFCNTILTTYYFSTVKDLDKIAKECNIAGKFIHPNSVVLPLNYSNHWLTFHFSNYLGVDKPMIILENYESSTGYFPVKWNTNSIPNLQFGNISVENNPCIQTMNNKDNPIKTIDYVFVLGQIEDKIDSCSIEIKRVIKQNYSLTYRSNSCMLYKLKKEL